MMMIKGMVQYREVGAGLPGEGGGEVDEGSD